MPRRINRDADGIVRGKIPTIRQYDTDARFRGGRSTSLYYYSDAAETTTFGKKWPNQLRSMTISNASDTVDLLATVIIVAGGEDKTFLNRCKIKVGTALVITEEDLTIGSDEYFKLVTTASAGTPLTQIIIRF